jgi:hypothetical protein
MLCLLDHPTHTMAKAFNQVLQRAAFRTTIWLEGPALNRIGPHSIQASGTMALYLNNVPPQKNLPAWPVEITNLYDIHSHLYCILFRQNFLSDGKTRCVPQYIGPRYTTITTWESTTPLVAGEAPPFSTIAIWRRPQNSNDSMLFLPMLILEHSETGRSFCQKEGQWQNIPKKRD